MEVCGLSHPGRKRPHNEDNILMDDKRGIFIVADGMGGRRSGEFASKMAIEITYDMLKAEIKEDTKDNEISILLSMAVQRSHEAINLSGQGDIVFQGMGTTLVICLIRGSKGFICHAGDSRAYLVRNRIKQLTRDQTLGNYLVDYVKKPHDQVPEKAWHTLIQALGVSKKLTPRIATMNLQNNDVLLLCSDGLTDMVKDDVIESIILSNLDKNFKETAQLLVDEANRNGGRDNISVILVRYTEDRNDTFWRTDIF